MHFARARAVYSGVLLAGLTLSACGNPNGHAHAKAQAVAACHDYFSVIGMNGDEARAAYREGSRLAAAAASADRAWQPLATAYTAMSTFSDDIDAAGQIPSAEEPSGMRATQAVANMCARLLGRDLERG